MFSPLLLILALALQGAPQNTPTDAVTFLSSVIQRYVDAKSYHIEATREITTSNELHRSWEKNILKAIIAPGGRYRYESRSGFGSAALVCNGTTKWVYHGLEHKYTADSVSNCEEDKHRAIPMEEYATTFYAKYLVSNLSYLSDHLKSASFLPDEKVVIGGSTVECRVIRFTDTGFKVRKPDIKMEETVWVDKARNLIVKTFERSDGYAMLPGSDARAPEVTEDATEFTVTTLGEDEPESSFTFSPPSNAKLVASFPNRFLQAAGISGGDLLGKASPEIRLKGEGKEIALSSYRGKPVFIDFWATYCAPCLDMLAELKTLYKETANKGLIWISIDSDQDASTAAAFIKQEQIPWPNYHDDDGSLGKAFGRGGIPLGVLIDREGKVAFYKVGYDLAELRAAIAKLGPEFAGVAGAPAEKTSAPANR